MSRQLQKKKKKKKKTAAASTWKRLPYRQNLVISVAEKPSYANVVWHPETGKERLCMPAKASKASWLRRIKAAGENRRLIGNGEK